MPDKLIIPLHLANIIFDHVHTLLPEEVCGILGGNGELVKCVIPITNVLHSPVQFRMAPDEQFRAFFSLESNAFDMLGYYHSHPKGPFYPSDHDRENSFYPGVIVVILSPAIPNWKIKGFIIRSTTIEEVDIEISA
jgi:proteasome lid subunit RPN8/RPN11